MKSNIYFKFSILSLTFFYSCLYKAGNRQADLNISIPVSINTYYVDSYLREKWMKSSYDSPVNSELVNYPKDFIPLTDSFNKLKYVIELRVSGDSLHNDGWGLILSSIYSFEKNVWFTDRKSLKNNELSKFKSFFLDSVLLQASKLYKNKIPDSILLIDKSKDIRIIELK